MIDHLIEKLQLSPTMIDALAPSTLEGHYPANVAVIVRNPKTRAALIQRGARKFPGHPHAIALDLPLTIVACHAADLDAERSDTEWQEQTIERHIADEQIFVSGPLAISTLWARLWVKVRRGELRAHHVSVVFNIEHRSKRWYFVRVGEQP